MSTLSVTTVNTANGTTDLTFTTGNTAAGKFVVPAAGGLVLSSNSTTNAVTISTSGNMGIGTSSPTSKFQVNGGVTINGSSFPSSGVGLELAWDGTESVVQSYNRNTTSYQPIWIESGSYTRFGMNGGEAMRIDSSGNVGIGTTSPSGKLDVRGTTYLGNGTIRLAMYSDQSDTGISIEAANYANDTKKNIWLAAYGGNLMVGTTSQIRSSKLSVFGGDVYAPGFKVGSTTANIYVYEGSTNVLTFQVGNTGSLRYFNFDTSGNGNALNGSWVNGSDARLKENVKTLNKGLSEVLSLHPVSYNRIGAEQTEIGFIAQEVQSIIPEVVHDTGEYLGISYGNITAVLVSAIQELSARLAALETK